MRVVLNFLAATFLVLVATPALAESAADVVEAGTVTFVEAFNSGDGNRLAALYTQDAVLLPPAAPRIAGREDIANFWQGAMDSGLRLARIEPLEVIESGDLAVDTGVIYLNAPDGSGGMVEVAMKYVVAWQKGEDGVWRLHRDAWNAM
jgi:uncharacterized protein (TIGR02246 family)